MTTQTEQALQHLKATITAFGPDSGIQMDRIAWSKLHAAIKEALAAPQGEPVGYVYGEIQGGTYRISRATLNTGVDLPSGTPLYAHPAPAPLTDEYTFEIAAWRVSFNNGETWTLWETDPQESPGMIVQPLLVRVPL